MGVLIPNNPLFEPAGVRLYSFHKSWYLGEWEESPLFHRKEEFKPLSDVALCQIAGRADGKPHQPLQLSNKKFVEAEMAYAIGYAEMEDIPVEHMPTGKLIIPEFNMDLYVSKGPVNSLFPDNHETKQVPAPGPSFDFLAKIPVKMSGGSIFSAQGMVIKGVVSRSFAGEKHAYGSMIGPFMQVEFEEGQSLNTLIRSGTEGMSLVHGNGL